MGTKMKAFVISALLGLAAAAPTPDVSSHVISHGHGAVVSHGTHAAHHGLAHHGVVAAHELHHGVVAHPVAHGLQHGVVAHPVAHGLHHGVVAHPVADDYSKANFNAAETADAAGVVSGSYDVALPDG